MPRAEAGARRRSSELAAEIVHATCAREIIGRLSGEPGGPGPTDGEVDSRAREHAGDLGVPSHDREHERAEPVLRGHVERRPARDQELDDAAVTAVRGEHEPRLPVPIPCVDFRAGAHEIADGVDVAVPDRGFPDAVHVGLTIPRRRRRTRGRYPRGPPGTNRPAIAAIHASAAATMASAPGSVATSAVSPMSGGPARKPTYPAVPTAAIPSLAATPGRRPAVRNTIGIRFASPKPTAAHPAIAATGWPTASAAPKPIAAVPALVWTSAALPQRATSPSPRKRPAAIVSEKAAKPSAAVLALVPSERSR